MSHRSFVVSASYEPIIKLWDMSRGKNIASIQHSHSQVNCVSVTESGSQLGVGTWQRVAIYDTHTMISTPILALDAMTRNVTALGFQSEGRWMYTGGEDDSCKIFDMRGGNQLVCQRLCETQGHVQSVVLHANQVELFISDVTGNVYCWDLRAGVHEVMPVPLSLNEFITKLDVNPQGNTLVGVSTKGKLFRWNLLAGEDGRDLMCCGEGSRTIQPKPWTIHDVCALCCSFSPDGQYLSTSSSNGSIKIFNWEKLKEEKELNIGASWVWQTLFTGDSTKLIAGGETRLNLLDIESGKVLVNYEGHSKWITALCAFDPY